MTSFHQKNVFYFGDSLFSVPFFLTMNMHRKKRVNFFRWRPFYEADHSTPRCVGGGLQLVNLGRQSEMALQAGQLTLCGLNERFSPPVVMFLDSHPAGDQAPVLMVQVGQEGLQRDVVYLDCPIAPAYMTTNAGERGEVSAFRGLSQSVQLYIGAQINFGDLIHI